MKFLINNSLISEEIDTDEEECELSLFERSNEYSVHFIVPCIVHGNVKFISSHLRGYLTMLFERTTKIIIHIKI